ncbi:hypothetical protein AURDEDRAFT_138581 [Auricularia subglabra TFB-10046 SS5]|nr:hypothetical protein AURDEDRAFT_138581 [Auricularia subglabra TFB-10046 SS5]
MRTVVAILLLWLGALVGAQCPSPVSQYDVSKALCDSIICQRAISGTGAVRCSPAVASVGSGQAVVRQDGLFVGATRCYVMVNNVSPQANCTVLYTGLDNLAAQAMATCPTANGWVAGTCRVNGVPVTVAVREQSG